MAAVPEKPEDISKVKTEILTLPADEKYMRNIAGQIFSSEIRCVRYRYIEIIAAEIFKNILGFIKAVPIFVLENRLKLRGLRLA